MELQHYNPNDLLVRTAIAACSIGCTASSLATKWRRGSISHCDQKNLEIAVNQLNSIRSGFRALALPATTTITVLGDGATGTPSHVTINGVVVSDTFTYSTDNTTTATAIADAINNLVSAQDYTAYTIGDRVMVTAVDSGAAINSSAVAVIGGDVLVAAQFMTGGQNGVLASENILTEAQIERMFNNISKFTGCCYAPLGYGYESSPTSGFTIGYASNALN